MNTTNPFLIIENPRSLGPGSFEMALPLVNATYIRPGMRVLEVGGGSGQVAAILAKHWNVSVVTLEPWAKTNEIQAYATEQGVENQVLQLKLKAQSLPFADNTFDAVISIGSFEMIKDDRPLALSEMIRVAKTNAHIGIAEPMCLPEPLPDDMAESAIAQSFQQCFRTVEWNRDLFSQHGLAITESYYFSEARKWWLEYRDQKRISEAEQELITRDNGRWISLGLVVGKKQL